MSHDVIIIGGGVAGLSAALEFLKLGMTPLILEAGNYPAQKVCGEFLSPECLPILKQWQIEPIPILKSRFHSREREFALTFPQSAGGLSHWVLDKALAERVSSLGAEIRTQTKVESIQPKEHSQQKHRLKLSTGQILETSTLVIGIGRIPGLQTVAFTPKYIGLKAHFKGIELHHTLEMFGFTGAYLGLSEIEEGKANLACLVSLDEFKKFKSPSHFIEKLCSENPKLSQFLAGAELLFEWMTALVPNFGFKDTPSWQDSYFIGDAAMTIPPACGGGLSLGTMGGILAARYAAKGDDIGFRKDYRSSCSSVLRAAKGLQTVLMHPTLLNGAIQVCSLFPPMGQMLLRLTRPPTHL